MPEFADGFKRYGNNFAVPSLFIALFPSWFVGVAFAAIAIGALVPAAIMSIATASLFTRNIYREFIRPDCTDAQESQMAKIVSLVIKAGALVFIFAIPFQYAIWLQLLGGIWIIQTLPPVILALYTRMLNGWASADRLGDRILPRHLDVRDDELQPGLIRCTSWGTTVPCYAALASVVVNVVVSFVLSLFLNAVWSDRHKDVTVASDYAHAA